MFCLQIIEDDNERLAGGSSARRRDADVDMSSASVMTKYAISVDNRSPKVSCHIKVFSVAGLSTLL